MRRPSLKQVPTGALSSLSPASAASAPSAPSVRRWSEARAEDRSEAGPSPDELRPDELTRACTRMLRVAAAGMSLMGDDLRVPLGASDDTASLAERLQFTAGSGPCWAAESTGQPVRVSTADMQQRWPRFATSLLERTPYRSIVSVPLTGLGNGWRGALDLYLDQPTRAHVFGVAEACIVADLVAAELRTALNDQQPTTTTWLALGMVAVERDTSAGRALQLVREHASDAPTHLVAKAILDGTLGTGDLGADRDATLAVAV